MNHDNIQYLVLHYYELGEEGWEYFEEQEDAIKWIEENVKNTKDLSRVELYEVDAIPLEPIETFTKLRVKND